ncbi:MAG: hypothetical protein AB4290_17635 [Spirulina sp.]
MNSHKLTGLSRWLSSSLGELTQSCHALQGDRQTSEIDKMRSPCQKKYSQ